MRIFVTGSEGFIGSHLVDLLLKKGYQVDVLIQYNSFGNLGWLEAEKVKNNSQIKIFFGDVRDFSYLKSSMSGADSVIHLAALIAIPYSYHAPYSYVETNTIGTLNVLQAARELEIARVVHTSTSEVYGTAIQIPISENHPIQTQSPYSASKSAADMLAYSYYCSFNLPVVTLRPFNVYGPRQSVRAVIPSLISQIIAKKNRILVGNIKSTREFNFVEDTVAAFERAIHTPNIEGKVLNIGNSHETSIEQLIGFLREISNADFDIAEDSSRLRPEKSEVQRLLSDSSLARNLLNWQPKHSGEYGLKLGLSKTFEWFSDPKNFAKYNNDDYLI